MPGLSPQRGQELTLESLFARPPKEQTLPKAADPPAGTAAAVTETGDEPGAVLRRSPFSENPMVGAKGQQTQQRILDSAMRVFGDVGFHPATIDAITQVAGCSRVSFYQYFSSKDDVFRQLAGQVARQLRASTERLDPVTPTADGWEALRGWVQRYADVYERYEAVFRAFPSAAESDTTLVGDSVRTANSYGAGLRARVVDATASARDIDVSLQLLREALTCVLGDLATLRTAAEGAFPGAAVLDAFTDVAHRTLFGTDESVNVHGMRGATMPALPFGPVMRAALDRDAEPAAATAKGGRARAALVDAAQTVFVARGFHGTRVNDIVEAAGVSHGAFYRYFKNRDQLAQLVAADAMRKVATTMTTLPDLADDSAAGRASLRRWLRAYNRAQAEETAMIRVWADAAVQDAALLADSAAMVDWGRRRIARALRGRALGPADADALVMLGVLEAFGVSERPERMLDAAMLVIERGVLGR